MKLNFSIDKASLQKLLKRGNKTDRALWHPVRDWLIVLGSIVVLIIALVVYHVTLFLATNGEHKIQSSITTPPPAVNREVLNTTLTNIQARGANFGGGSSTPQTPSDPSR